MLIAALATIAAAAVVAAAYVATATRPKLVPIPLRVRRNRRG